MAGDWIKMRGTLITNPKVIRMARFLAESRQFMEWFTRGTGVTVGENVYELCDVTVVTRVTVGSLLGVWAAVNECANQDGFLKGITLFEVDEMAGVPGFGDAMALVGWIENLDGGIVFVNFSEHNTVGKERSTSAKTGAERTKEWREKKKKGGVTGDVTVTSQRDHREEKIREDSKQPPLSPQGEKRAAVCLKTFLDECTEKQERPLRDYQPLWLYVESVGLDTDMVALAWAEFRRQMLPGGVSATKRQADWRKTFRNYVEKNYLKLWAIDPEGKFFLTTAGKTAQKMQDALEPA
jgi:hypothetical protein